MIILGNILLFGCLFMCSQNSATVVGAPVYAGGLSVRWGSGSHGTDAVSAVGAAVSLVDLFSIYNCPATNITAVNAIANIAPANCGTSSILYFYLLQTGGRPRERVIQTRRGESTAQTLAQCDSEQAGAKQDKTANGHSEKTIRSEIFTHCTPPTARDPNCVMRLKLMWARNPPIPLNSVLGNHAVKGNGPSSGARSEVVLSGCCVRGDLAPEDLSSETRWHR